MWNLFSLFELVDLFVHSFLYVSIMHGRQRRPAQEFEVWRIKRLHLLLLDDVD